MKKLTIFGNPVEHSISPVMHNNALKKFSIDGIYTKTLVEDGTKIKEIFLQNFDGANVTVPHKEIAFKLCDEVRGIANKIKAVNTLVNENGKMVGYNTDAPGFYKSIEKLKIKNCLILGAGGSSRAISFYLKQQGLKVSILNRSEEKLHFFKKNDFKTFIWNTLDTFDFDLIINTTTAGLKEDILPAPKELLEKVLNNSKYTIDIIYNKQTPFLKLAKQLHNATKDGKDMLLYQGVLAFNIFFNNTLDEEKITTYMKETL